MIRFKKILVAVSAVALTVPILAANCPTKVKSAATKAYPDAKVVACKQEKEKGRPANKSKDAPKKESNGILKRFHTA